MTPGGIAGRRGFWGFLFRRRGAMLRAVWRHRKTLMQQSRHHQQPGGKATVGSMAMAVTPFFWLSRMWGTAGLEQ